MDHQSTIPRRFENPVFSQYLADPFCWLHEGVYYAVGTGKQESGSNPTPGNVVPLGLSPK